VRPAATAEDAARGVGLLYGRLDVWRRARCSPFALAIAGLAEPHQQSRTQGCGPRRPAFTEERAALQRLAAAQPRAPAPHRAAGHLGPRGRGPNACAALKRPKGRHRHPQRMPLASVGEARMQRESLVGAFAQKAADKERPILNTRPPKPLSSIPPVTYEAAAAAAMRTAPLPSWCAGATRGSVLFVADPFGKVSYDCGMSLYYRRGEAADRMRSDTDAVVVLPLLPAPPLRSQTIPTSPQSTLLTQSEKTPTTRAGGMRESTQTP